MLKELLVACALIAPVATASAQSVSFVDVTQSAGVWGSYFLPGKEIPGGGAVVDVNNDGFQDIFVLGGYSSDRLFMNDGDGTFTESALAWGVSWSHRGVGVAVGDYNNDGWMDLYVTSFGPAASLGQHRLYRNEGGTHFTDQAVLAGVNATSALVPDGYGAAFGDYDLDGDLDLFVGGWESFDGNRLFQNQGNGTFVDVTATALGPIASYTFSPRFVDMNDDFYPELLLAADFATSRYFRNDGFGGFVDDTNATGTGLDHNGMGHTVADYNGDGLLDWYVTSIFANGLLWPTVPGTGNMLYMQQPDQTFLETATPANVDDGGWGWGTVSIDFDHDGFVDIVETNGFDDDVQFENEQSYAFRNNGLGVFTDVSVATGIANHNLQGRGLASFDYDNDGDQDLVFFANNDLTKLYRCDLTGPDQHWLRVFLNTAGTSLAPNGVGSRVRVRALGVQQVRSVDGGCNYLSQSELSAHFGLGAATMAQEVRVEWSNGIVTALDNVAVDQTLTIAPGAFTFRRGDVNGDNAVNLADAIAALVAVFGGGTPVPCLRACDTNADSLVDVSDPIFLLNGLFNAGASDLIGECVYGDTPGTLPCSIGSACP
ncbi:MAG: FG-GAP-like repeat-containing protein [Planctomycetota bacterium]